MGAINGHRRRVGGSFDPQLLNDQVVFAMEWKQVDKESRYDWDNDFPAGILQTDTAAGFPVGGTRRVYMTYRQEGGYINRRITSPTGFGMLMGSPAYLRNGFADNMDYSGMQMHDGNGNDYPFFISEWIYPTNLTDNVNHNFQAVFSNFSGNASEQGFFTRIFLDRSYELSLGASGENIVHGIPLSDLTINQWNHVVWSYNGDKNNPIVSNWVNGVQNATILQANNGYTGMKNTLHYTSIGNISGANAQHFQGSIGQVYIAKNIEANGITAEYLYNNGIGKTYPFN